VFNSLFCQESGVTKCLHKSMRRHDITGQQQNFERLRRGEPLCETRLGSKYPERWLRDRTAQRMLSQLLAARVCGASSQIGRRAARVTQTYARPHSVSAC
jgi:hypothetical protein